MKSLLTLGVIGLALACAPAESFAAGRKNAAVGGGDACATVGQTCAADCNAVGWCSRLVCVGGKWEKRLISCVTPFCPRPCGS
jgi:hypothetical protein